jgi:hypothetical protein
MFIGFAETRNRVLVYHTQGGGNGVQVYDEVRQTT